MMQLALTFNDIFKSSFLEQVDSFAPLDMVIALALAFALGLFILLIYRKTFSGVMYSASFGLSLMALTLITTLVIMAVTSNVVLSLGMVGALSIVRFRAAIKEPMDMRSLMIKVQDKAVKIKNLQDKVLPQLKQQLADTKGLFKGKERKALEVKIKKTEAEIADRLDKIPDTLKADGYPDVQVFMRTFREMESVVEQYNRDLAEWEYQVSRKPTAATKEQHRQPEKQSVLKHLREIQERNKQKPPQRQHKKSIDRDSR